MGEEREEGAREDATLRHLSASFMPRSPGARFRAALNVRFPVSHRAPGQRRIHGAAGCAPLHRLVQQIPDPRQHLVRYYGSYANRARRDCRSAQKALDGGGRGGPDLDPDADPESEFATERRQSWARLLRKILESLPRHSAAGATAGRRDPASRRSGRRPRPARRARRSDAIVAGFVA